jgi:two-component system, sensor histidine kinase and response regulator
MIAICAACAAVDLAARITAARGPIRRARLDGGAIAMGLGIWSMHYCRHVGLSVACTCAL